MQHVLDVNQRSTPRAGSEKDFEDHILPLAEAGYRVACAMLHDPQAAQDAVQEASLRAWRKLAGVKDRARLRPWFLGIVVNECRNSRRLKWVAGVNLGLPAELSIASAEEKVLQGADLRRAVSQLDPRDRLVVVPLFLCGPTARRGCGGRWDLRGRDARPALSRRQAPAPRPRNPGGIAMSLRTDIRSAYEEITPPAPALQAQIRALVAAEAQAASKSGGGRSRWVASLRGTMALVAVLLVILIVATVLVGGRLMQDWNLFTNRPTPAGQIDPAQLAALEARPLHLPSTKLGDTCPFGPSPSASTVAGFPEPLRSWSGVLLIAGEGPVYAFFHSAIVDSAIPEKGVSEPYAEVDWAIEPQVTGLVLIRDRDTLTHTTPVVYTGPYAAGAVVGTDTVSGTRVDVHAELVLDAGHHPANSGSSGWGIYTVQPKVSPTRSNCQAFQVDGQGFSEVFVPYTGAGPVRATL